MKYGILSFILLLSGCVTVSDSGLYWGDYLHTKYKMKEDPGATSNKGHEEELMLIVSKSKELGLKVPPGIYAELGLFAMENGDNGQGLNYFNLEKSEYPESKVLMDRVIQEQQQGSN